MNPDPRVTGLTLELRVRVNLDPGAAHRVPKVLRHRSDPHNARPLITKEQEHNRS